MDSDRGSDFAVNTRLPKSTAGLFLALVGPISFALIATASKCQPFVSHSSTEAEHHDEVRSNVVMLPLRGGGGGANASTKRFGCDSCKGAGGDSCGPRKKDPHSTICCAENGLAICEDKGATNNNALAELVMPMLHLSRAHRANLAWLYELALHGGSSNAKYVNAKQQCADIFTTGSTNSEARLVLLSISHCST